MKAVVLAAGEGSRMRPLTYTRPKVMLPIANKPILEHLLIEMRKAGIREFIFVVGYHDEQIRRYFGSGDQWGVSIDYCTQRKQLGTADAIKMVERLVDEHFLVVNGDIVIDGRDIKNLADRNGCTMSVIEVEDTHGLGLVELVGDKVVRIYEKIAKAPSHVANAALYLFSSEIFAAVSQTSQSARGEYEITDSLQLMIDQGRCISYQKIDGWLDVSYPWDLLAANESLLAGVGVQNLGEVEEVVAEAVALHDERAKSPATSYE